MTKKEKAAQAALIEAWEKYIGIAKATNRFGMNKSAALGHEALGLSRQAWWKYRTGRAKMPFYVRHAMANIANGMAAWGDE